MSPGTFKGGPPGRKVRALEREMDAVIAKQTVYAEASGAEQRLHLDETFEALRRCDAVAPQYTAALLAALWPWETPLGYGEEEVPCAGHAAC